MFQLFFGNPRAATPSSDTVKTGTGGIDPGDVPRRNIFKPSGLLDRPLKRPELRDAPIVDEPQTESDIAEISDKPITQMTMPEIDFEIGYLMKKLYRTQEEELILMLLIAASE